MRKKGRSPGRLKVLKVHHWQINSNNKLAREK